MNQYKKNSLSLWGAVSMGTGVMVGAGIFALTGQLAELAREWFPLAAIITGFSVYSYVKLSNAYSLAKSLASEKIKYNLNFFSLCRSLVLKNEFF